MFLLGLLIILCSLGFSVVVLGGDLSYFIDLPSLIFIICPILGVLTATRSFKTFYAGLKAAVFPKSGISEKSRKQAVSLFRLLSKTAGMAAAIAAIICLVNMMMNLNFSDTRCVSSLGINLAVSLISLLYGLLLIVAVFEPIVFILKKQRNPERDL